MNAEQWKRYVETFTAEAHAADVERFLTSKPVASPDPPVDNSRCKFAQGGACCVRWCGDKVCKA